MLSTGQKAPSFSLKDQNGRLYNLKDYRGKWLILYFYPKDMTPGCTKQACSFRDSLEKFHSLNTKIVGISADSPASHAEFVDRYQLPFTLLSDRNKQVIKIYHAAHKKTMFDNNYTGIRRITYLVNPQGKIAKTYSRVNLLTHTKTVLRDLQTLQNS